MVGWSRTKGQNKYTKSYSIKGGTRKGKKKKKKQYVYVIGGRYRVNVSQALGSDIRYPIITL